MSDTEVHLLWDCDSSDWIFHVGSECGLHGCVFDTRNAPIDAIVRWQKAYSDYEDAQAEIDKVWDGKPL
jgi:hypothetical protein